MAKQNLGLINPGEEVIVIPKSDSVSGGDAGGSGDAAAQNNGQELSNPQKWWEFFFDLNK